MLRNRKGAQLSRAPNPTKTIQNSGGARGAASGSCARIFCIHCFISFLVLLIAAGGFLVIRMGFGAPFELNDAYVDATPLLPESALKVVASLQVPPGNLAVSASGLVFFNFHPEYSPPIHEPSGVRTKVAVLGAREGGTQFTRFASTKVQILTRLLRTRKFSPTKQVLSLLALLVQKYNNDAALGARLFAYANTTTKGNESEFSSWRPFPNASFQSSIVSCLSMRVDSWGRVWLLDFGNHGIESAAVFYVFEVELPLQQQQEEAVKREVLGREVLQYRFPADVAGFGSMLNDFQIDSACAYAYIADTSILAATPALIVFDIRNRKSYRLLSGDKRLRGDSVFASVGGVPVKLGPIGVRINVDSIALDRSGKFLYLGAVTSNRLYKVRVASIHDAIRDAGDLQVITDAKLASELTGCRGKPLSDGASSDASGFVWLTAMSESALAVVRGEDYGDDTGGDALCHVTKVIESQKLLRWPDGLSFGSDGIYVTESALHLKMSSGGISDKAPFHILKIAAEDLRRAFGQDYQLPLPGQ